MITSGHLKLLGMRDNQSGFITMSVMTVLVAVSAAIALSALLSVMVDTDVRSFAHTRIAAVAAAQGCIEEARSGWWDAVASGSTTRIMGNASCSAQWGVTASGTWRVQAQGARDPSQVRLVADFEISTNASGSADTVTQRWLRQVADFE